MSKEIAEEYASSLADLTVNSKPLINMLTILAEENIEHAGIIVETVEKHLEKVHPDIKLPVLYLVDSIIKNVGGAYTQKFSQSIVNMFTKTFKQVDEKIRTQMFKLRETWIEVFPATKLYQLDVKANLIDPAWPIQAQPQQSNIHVNPNFLKKSGPTTSTATPLMSEEERNIIAKKEQELLMLQKKKIEMELEQTRKQLELAEQNAKNNAKKLATVVSSAVPAPAMPIALVNPVVTPIMNISPEVTTVPIKQRLGPPVNKSSARIAPVSASLITARRDPRLARHQPPPMVTPSPAPPPIAPNVFDIKPLDRVTKRKNVITIDVRPELAAQRPTRDPRRREQDRNIERSPGSNRPRPRRRDQVDRPPTTLPKSQPDKKLDDYIEKLQLPDPRKINKLPPIPKLNRDEPAPPKRRKESTRDKKKKSSNETGKDESNISSPEKSSKSRESKKKREQRPDTDKEVAVPEVIAFKELKNYHKERYMRRNKEKSDSPEPQAPSNANDTEASSKISVNVTRIWG